MTPKKALPGSCFYEQVVANHRFPIPHTDRQEPGRLMAGMRSLDRIRHVQRWIASSNNNMGNIRQQSRKALVRVADMKD